MSFEGTSGYRIKLGENISLTIAKKQMVSLKALHDRIGSRSNDDLDHILGKKDRNWLHF